MALEFPKDFLEETARLEPPKDILGMPEAQSAITSGRMKGEADRRHGKSRNIPTDNPDLIMRSVEIEAYVKAFNGEDVSNKS